MAVNQVGDQLQFQLPGIGSSNINQIMQALQAAFGQNQSGNQTTTGQNKTSGSSNTNTNQTGSQTQNQTGTSQQTGVTNTNGVLESIANTIGQTVGQQNTSQNGTSTTNEGSALATQMLGQIFPQLLAQAGSGQFSKESAIKDSGGAIDLIMRDYKENVLPKIAVGEARSGGYSGTAKMLLSNDAAVRAAEAAAAVTANNVASYAQISNQQQQQLLSAINTAANASRSSTTTQNQNGSVSTNNQNTQSQVGSQTQTQNQNQNVVGSTNQTGTTNTNQTGTSATTTGQTQDINQQTNTSQQNPGLIKDGALQTGAGILAGIPAILAIFRGMGINDLASLGKIIKGITGQDVNVNDYGTGSLTPDGVNMGPDLPIPDSGVPNLPDPSPDVQIPEPEFGLD